MWQSDAVGPSSDGHRYCRFRWVREKKHLMQRKKKRKGGRKK